MASPSLTGTVVDLEIPSRPGDMEAGSLSGLGVLITSAELPPVRRLVAPHRHLGMFALTSLPLLPGPLGFRNIKSHDSPLAFHLFPGGSLVGYPNRPRLTLPLSLCPGPRLVHEQQSPVLCPCSAKVQANSYVASPPPPFFADLWISWQRSDPILPCFPSRKHKSSVPWSFPLCPPEKGECPPPHTETQVTLPFCWCVAGGDKGTDLSEELIFIKLFSIEPKS